MSDNRPRWTEGMLADELVTEPGEGPVTQLVPAPLNSWKGYYWLLGIVGAVPIWLDVASSIIGFSRGFVEIGRSRFLMDIHPVLWGAATGVTMVGPVLVAKWTGELLHWRFSLPAVAGLIIGTALLWAYETQVLVGNLRVLGIL